MNLTLNNTTTKENWFSCTEEMSLHGVAIGYGRKVIASDLTATLHRGELTCLVGRNGTGKSTLMRTMAAFIPPLAGRVALGTEKEAESRDIASLSAIQKAKMIGVVLTEKPEVQDMTVREMVAMGRSPYTGFFGRLSQEDDAAVEEALRMVGMADFRQRKVLTLSDGERQKVMIAKALAQQTPFIFLDEPTAFLDYPSKREMMETLLRLCHEQGKAVLLSTHDLDIALRHCDRIWHLTSEGLSVLSPDEVELSLFC